MAEVTTLPAPLNVVGSYDASGNIKLTWDKVDGALAYVIHYGDANVTDPKLAIKMGYSETNAWTLNSADVPAHTDTDKLSFYVQSFSVLGTGDTDIAKAQQLNTAEDITGSAWSTAFELAKVIKVTGVSLDQTSISVNADEIGTKDVSLKATFNPTNATDQTGKWGTSDTSLATVTGGKVTIKDGATGTFSVSFTTNDGGFTASADITIVPKVVVPTGPIGYTVVPGDDIATVSTAHGVSVGWVRYVNHLAGLKLPVGRIIYFEEVED